jgi:hypothetical protein
MKTVPMRMHVKESVVTVALNEPFAATTLEICVNSILLYCFHFDDRNVDLRN